MIDAHDGAYLAGFVMVWIWAAATAPGNGGLTYLYVLLAGMPGSLVYFLLADGVAGGLRRQIDTPA